MNAESISKILIKRKADAHKGDFGRALIICGSPLMPGAAIIAAGAALRCGVGLVTVASGERVISACAAALPEAVYFDTSAERNELIAAIKRADAILIGCGLGQSEKSKYLLKTVLEYGECPLVIDADGINMVAGGIQLNEYAGEICLTPHAGEMGRLLSCDAAAVQADRSKAAFDCVSRYGVTTVLKGSGTITAFKDGSSIVNTTGNAGMAKPGSGDMLGGMMVSLLAQGIEPQKAIPAAVYLHGMAGDIAAAEYTQRAMQVSDMINVLPRVFKNFE